MMDEKEPEDVVKQTDDDDEKDKQRSPLLQIAEWQYRLRLPDSVFPAASKEQVKANLFQEIKKNNMAPFYKSLCASLGLPVDNALHAEMSAANEQEIKKLTDKIEEAKQHAGDMEVREGLFNKAEYFAKIGDRDQAIPAYAATLEKSVGAGSRIDLVFATIRLAFFHQDTALVKKYIDQAHGFVESGGDWERRNLLKIYEAAYSLLVRDFKKAGALFIDSIATFTCYELFDYNTFIFYAVLSALLTVDRVTLKSKVLRSPEVLGCIREIPNLQGLLESFYRSKYADFFAALARISDQIKVDMFMGPHYGYFIREIRIVAYKQYLQSYSSVKLSSMSESFGVSVEFLDTELAKFIASGRLNCKVDKVSGIVETSRPDAKNQQYRKAITEGDALLNRIQKLTKVIAD